MNKEMALDDIVLEDVKTLHIEAIGKVICENPSCKYKNVNVDIEFSKMKHPTLDVDVWQERTITGEMVTKKKVIITFEDYDLIFLIK